MEFSARHIAPPISPLEYEDLAPGSIATSPILMVASAVALACLAKFFGPTWLQQAFRTVNFAMPEQLAACLVALFTSVVLHECGHLLAAKALGFEILGGMLGPFRVSQLHGQRWVSFSVQSLFGGSISAIPRRNESWREHMLVVVGAGPAVTLLTCIAAAILAPKFAARDHAYFTCLAQINFVLFVLGLIPSSVRSETLNDARIFLSLLRRTPESNRIFLYHVVTQLRIQGCRPRTYPLWAIERMARVPGSSGLTLLFAQTIAHWALDRGDLASAEAWNAHAVQVANRCDARLRNSALAEAAFLDVVLRDDIRNAQQKICAVDPAYLTPKWMMYRAKAVLALTQGSIDEALAHICRAAFWFPKEMPYYDFQRMLLVRLSDVAKQAR
ncbi:MAG: hypothetical protein JO061_21870 [Acidobacteriaceae bacterium]|nr:hypothetical protein [Acidobacteriaceae bacterium]